MFPFDFPCMEINKISTRMCRWSTQQVEDTWSCSTACSLQWKGISCQKLTTILVLEFFWETNTSFSCFWQMLNSACHWRANTHASVKSSHTSSLQHSQNSLLSLNLVLMCLLELCSWEQSILPITDGGEWKYRMYFTE